MSGITPDLTLLPRAAIELELTLASSWWVPALRLSAARGEGSATAVGVGRATFVWTGARIELCPLRAGAGVGPYARPCLGSDIAVIDAQGRDLDDPRSASRPWIGPLIALRAGWRLPFGLLAEIYGGGSFPLVDDKFQFDDRRVPEKVTVHDVPSLSFFTGLAAGFSGDIL